MMMALMVLHVCLLNLDEHYYNKKRQHSKYEIVSVITDGFLFLLPLLLATFVTFDEKWVILYKTIAGISMVSVVKNELFYKGLEVQERFIHACLYVLHPILLFNFYESWKLNYFQSNYYFWMFQLVYVALGVKTVSYQLIYWNYIHDGTKK